MVLSAHRTVWRMARNSGRIAGTVVRFRVLGWRIERRRLGAHVYAMKLRGVFVIMATGDRPPWWLMTKSGLPDARPSRARRVKRMLARGTRTGLASGAGKANDACRSIKQFYCVATSQCRQPFGLKRGRNDAEPTPRRPNDTRPPGQRSEPPFRRSPVRGAVSQTHTHTHTRRDFHRLPAGAPPVTGRWSPRTRHPTGSPAGRRCRETAARDDQLFCFAHAL